MSNKDSNRELNAVSIENYRISLKPAERYESQNIQKKVYEEYLALIGPNWVLIDAYEGTIDEVHDAIWRKLEPRLKFGAETPKLLWNSDGGKSVDDQ